MGKEKSMRVRQSAQKGSHRKSRNGGCDGCRTAEGSAGGSPLDHVLELPIDRRYL